MYTIRDAKSVLFVCYLCLLPLLFAVQPLQGAEKTIIPLNGTWDIAEGSLADIPTRFYHKVAVPGLVDMAVPPFIEVGQKSRLREAFWYQRTFTFDGEVPDVALLKFHKAKFGLQVFVNGQLAGSSHSCFTPNEFDVTALLRGNKQQNVLTVGVGAFHDVLPANIPYGHDFEKITYQPGIYDDAELILTPSPHVVRVQLAPDIDNKRVRVVALVENRSAGAAPVALDTKITEAATARVAASAAGESVTLQPGESRTFDFTVPIPDCRLWSPEDPFLYEIEIGTGRAVHTERFGMRSFRFDTNTGRALLNGQTYFMRGTNVCIFRFFEDPDRGGKPWDEQWVRALHRKFKSMHWNSIRYCIGFPPEMWYRIADEEGLLIQDEYPVWGGGNPKMLNLDSDVLADEYTRMMQAHWNHPCVVIWDAQNETVTNVTGKAIQMVRGLDLSNRPWDNGWSEPQDESDGVETHPYLFSVYRRENSPPPSPAGPLADLLNDIKIPTNGPTSHSLSKKNFDDHPIIINEYGWIWLNRDGSTTTLTDRVYEMLKLKDVSPEVRLERYAYYLAALTEYWRSHRKCAGVLHFCGLGYSRSHEPRGQTSDHFIDLYKLTLEPHFEQYVGDAFSPIGLMIDHWGARFKPGAVLDVPVAVINDYAENQSVTVRLSLETGGKSNTVGTQQTIIPGNGRAVISFHTSLPKQTGACRIIAEIMDVECKGVKSFRDFVLAEE